MGAVINTGRDRIAQAQGAKEALVVNRFVFAYIEGLDHTADVDLDEKLPASNDIVHIQDVTASGYVAKDRVVYSCILGPNVGDFQFNWIGLQAEDETLIAVSYAPTQTKYATSGLNAGNTLTRNFLIQYDSAKETSGITVEAGVWQIDFMARLHSMDDHRRKDMEALYGDALFINDGFLVTTSGSTITAKAGKAYIGGLLAVLQNDTEISVGALPRDIYVDVSLVGDAAGSAVDVEIISVPIAEPPSNYKDSAGVQHYLARIATVDSGYGVSDHRMVVATPAPSVLEALIQKKELTSEGGAELVGARRGTVQSELDARIRRVASVEDMRSDVSLHLGDVVQTIEHTIGYGYEGGNLYEIVPGGMAAHDNGSFIDLDSGLQARGLFPAEPHPKQFGASIGGVADDATALSNYYRHKNSQAYVSDTLPTSYAVWMPPDQPNARTDLPDPFIDGFAGDANYYIDELWEPLRAAAPGYISRESLGLDESRTFDVWRYVFEPPEYDRTLILSSCMHGGEVSAMISLYRLLYHAVTNWKEHPQLAHLRWRCRLVVLPIVNPYGVSQAQRIRQNANGVDINRNFDYRWGDYPVGSPGDHDYKGPSAFSEAEARYVRDTFSAYRDAIAYIDLHNYGSGAQHLPIYAAAEMPSGDDVIAEVVSALRRPGEIVDVGRTYNPSGYAYAAANYGMYGFNPEWADGVYGDLVFSGADLTRMLRWHANIILATSYRSASAMQWSYVSPRCVMAYWASGMGSITWTNSTYAELADLRLNIPITRAGYLKVHGVAIVSASDPAALVQILPRIGQGGYGKMGVGDSLNYADPGTMHPSDWESYSTIDSTTARRAIPFVAAIPVYPTGYAREKASVGVYALTTAGTATLHRYRALIEFVPADQGDERMEVCTAIGREGQGVGAMQKEYPRST